MDHSWGVDREQKQPNKLKFWERAEFNLAIGVLLLVLGMLLSDIPTMIASLNWPMVPGVISSQRFIEQRFQEYDGDYYILIEGYLKYQYTVEGTSYTGFALNALQELSSPEDKTRSYPEGKEVKVYFNPRDPAQALLEPGLVFSGKAFGLAASVCCWAGLGLLSQGLWRKLTGRRYIIRGWPDD